MDQSWEAIAHSLRTAADALRQRPGSSVQMTIAERLQAAAEGRCDREADCRRCPVQCSQPGRQIQRRAASGSR
jgi:cell division protein FtsI/penicillin-binding protein 2